MSNRAPRNRARAAHFRARSRRPDDAEDHQKNAKSASLAFCSGFLTPLQRLLENCCSVKYPVIHLATSHLKIHGDEKAYVHWASWASVSQTLCAQMVATFLNRRYLLPGPEQESWLASSLRAWQQGRQIQRPSSESCGRAKSEKQKMGQDPQHSQTCRSFLEREVIECWRVIRWWVLWGGRKERGRERERAEDGGRSR